MRKWAEWFSRGLGGAALVLVVVLACEKVPTRAEKFIPLGNDYVPEASFCYWRYGKMAAVSVAFDDARPSHWQLAAPALEQYGFRGTFNLNTGGVDDWEPWIRLFQRGHEIGSHTRNHPNLAELPLSAAEKEIREANEDLREKIQGVKRVISFSYPYGSSTPAVRQICKRYHLCQKALNFKSLRGINRRPVNGETLSSLRGYGVYPPYDNVAFDQLLDETKKAGGWVVIYWHSLTKEAPSQYTAPYSLFLDLMEALRVRQDSIWVAKQADVACYVAERESTSVAAKVAVDLLSIGVSVTPDPYGTRCVPLTVTLPLPEAWRRKAVRLEVSPQRDDRFVKTGSSRALVDVLPGETVTLRALTSQ